MRNHWPLLLVLIGSAYAQEDGGGYGSPPKSTKSSGGYDAAPPAYSAPPPVYSVPPPVYSASPPTHEAPPPTYGAPLPGTITLTSTKTVTLSEYCAVPPPVTVTHVKNVTTTKTITSSEYCAIPSPVTVTRIKNITTTKTERETITKPGFNVTETKTTTQHTTKPGANITQSYTTTEYITGPITTVNNTITEVTTKSAVPGTTSVSTQTVVSRISETITITDYISVIQTIPGPTVSIPGPTETATQIVTSDRTVELSIPGPTQNITIPGPTQEITIPGPTQEITVPGPTQEITIPGPTQEITVPGPTQEITIPGPIQEVTIPNPTQEITIPGPTQEVTVPGPTQEVTIPGPTQTIETTETQFQTLTQVETQFTTLTLPPQVIISNATITSSVSHTQTFRDFTSGPIVPALDSLRRSFNSDNHPTSDYRLFHKNNTCSNLDYRNSIARKCLNEYTSIAYHITSFYNLEHSPYTWRYIASDYNSTRNNYDINCVRYPVYRYYVSVADYCGANIRSHLIFHSSRICILRE
ncbi:predicted protein [Pyrenophora tritici-repentis Pt-1C-BFP]|uniref:Uncharacterized protein n=1 Tax=Pyrenophora tritici-repentis (strain Pt-1C-BFP) TaxID=426418 RepID=B2W7S9_PYRTR|nr:uncharacterized protein PTRG_05867 [Pyrenophora tritici-repentis Pt-1C-BFP]EDU48787.1 predicted protein [Pyrenophora tritici-repentis Pt-1C-BFP]